LTLISEAIWVHYPPMFLVIYQAGLLAIRCALYASLTD